MTPTPRSTFSLKDALGLCIIAAVLLPLLTSCLESGQKMSQAQQCRNKMRELCLAALNFESATNRFPSATTGGEISNVSPVPYSNEDGYSWIVQLHGLRLFCPTNP